MSHEIDPMADIFEMKERLEQAETELSTLKGLVKEMGQMMLSPKVIWSYQLAPKVDEILNRPEIVELMNQTTTVTFNEYLSLKEENQSLRTELAAKEERSRVAKELLQDCHAALFIGGFPWKELVVLDTAISNFLTTLEKP